MSAKSGKKKTTKRAEQSVLGSLPATRPVRVGRARGTTTRRAATASEAPKKRAAKASTTAAAAKSRAAATPRPATPPPPQPDARRNGLPSGAALATTAVRAAGELAQIGFTVGTQVLKRAARRLPRP